MFYVVMSKVPLGVMYNFGNLHTMLVNRVYEEGKRATQNRLNSRTWAVEVYPSDSYSYVLAAVHLNAGRNDRDVAMRIGQINMLKAQFARFTHEDKNRNILLVGDLNALPNTLELKTLLAGSTTENTFVDPLLDSDFTHPARKPVR